MLRRVPTWIRLLILFGLLFYPVSLVLTWMLYPLWEWVEKTFGIKSVGHVWLADWCFYAVDGVLASIAIVVCSLVKRRTRVESRSSREL